MSGVRRTRQKGKVIRTTDSIYCRTFDSVNDDERELGEPAFFVLAPSFSVKFHAQKMIDASHDSIFAITRGLHMNH